MRNICNLICLHFLAGKNHTYIRIFSCTVENWYFLLMVGTAFTLVVVWITFSFCIAKNSSRHGMYLPWPILSLQMLCDWKYPEVNAIVIIKYSSIKNCEKWNLTCIILCYCQWKYLTWQNLQHFNNELMIGFMSSQPYCMYCCSKV